MGKVWELVEILVMIVPILLVVAFITIGERKGIGSIQRRLGPNTVGYYGVLQPFGDALKLLGKEVVKPSNSNRWLFLWSSNISLLFGLLCWGVIPVTWEGGLLEYKYTILYLLGMSSLGVYGIMIGGWSANSKYAFLGSIRSTSQLISYELILSSIILLVIYVSNSLDLNKLIIVQIGGNNMWILGPLGLIFVISGVCELQRPFADLSEGESELVSGYNTEHSGVIFVIYFLAEYSNLILISILIVLLFFGNNLIPIDISLLNFNMWWLIDIEIWTGLWIGLKISIWAFIFILIRATLPRIRFDQLIALCWTKILPGVIGGMFVVLGIVNIWEIYIY